MLKLKLLPRFGRILSSSSGVRVLARSFAADSGGGNGGGDDGDFYTDYLSQGPSPFERSRANDAATGYGGRGYRFSNRGRGSFRGGSVRGRGGRGARISRGPFTDQYGVDDDQPVAPVQLSEEDLKARDEMLAKLAEMSDEEDKKDEETDEDEDEGDGELCSIYEGFIDPRYDETIKEKKMMEKRNRYKDTTIPDDLLGEDDSDDYNYIDSDEEKKIKRKAKGRGAMTASGEPEPESDLEEEFGNESEEEIDEEEWEMMNEMGNKEFERHLQHRRNAKKLADEYDQRMAELGDKANDMEEVHKVQKMMMRKWRASYFMPRLVTPMEKEEMWKKNKENPDEWTVEKLAEEYEVSKARVHAILFLWDIRKQQGESQTAEEETRTYLDNLCFDDEGQPCLPPHMGEDKWVTTWNTRPNYKIMPADWEGTVRTEEEAIEEASAKEEAMMLEEFVRRLEFNKLQMAGLIKQNKHERRRPPGGWTYLIEKLGPEGKRGKRGGFRFVATADGRHRKLNDLEKLVLKREAVRPRKRIL